MLALAIFPCGALLAEVKPNPLFTNRAVLQRGQPVPVWGTAAEGEKVTVEFCGQKVTTTAKDGKWRVDLAALEAGGPFTMTISGENTVEVNNLLIGEVWLASGQSNMAWVFNKTSAAKDDTPNANYPQLRVFKVETTPSLTPQTSAGETWVKCSPERAGGFSAVAYYFARDLHVKLGVPVGIIVSAVGGTPAQAWTSKEGLSTHPELQEYAAQAKALADSDLPRGKARNQASTVFFNGMIAPLIPYAMKGVIWYQGESNDGESKQYQTLFPAMIADWRGRWKQGDFPFLYVQIAPCNKMSPEIREAQFLTLSKTQNAAMVVTVDVGDEQNIHPPQKAPVGARLALAARALAYGEKIVYSGPLYKSMEITGKEAVIAFDHVGGGLEARDGELKGFTIAGADGKHVPAKAMIRGDTVVISAEGVAEPKAVRYGWSNVPDVNLFNHEGLPASPFRTDED